MAITLESNYSKKLGLPGYSSHQYSVAVKTEVSDLSQVPLESNRLYELLQHCVDSQIQKTGFLPAAYQDGPIPIRQTTVPDDWSCSPKQKQLILEIVEEKHLDRSGIENLAQDRFGKGVQQLSKPEASKLIDELLVTSGSTNGNGRSG